MAVEEPHFTLVDKTDGFEIRDYPSLVVAEVRAQGSRGQASSAGFRLLAGYIFGGNTRGEKVAMNAPVTQAAMSGEKIAMTAPVGISRELDQWVVRFTMPSSYTLETLPRPNDARIELKALPPARFAVKRFSGLASDEDVEKQAADLAVALKARKLQALGSFSLARYNPPWTPWFMRRNEVMIAVEGLPDF